MTVIVYIEVVHMLFFDNSIGLPRYAIGVAFVSFLLEKLACLLITFI